MSHIHFFFIPIVASYCNVMDLYDVICESHIRCIVSILQEGRIIKVSEANHVKTAASNNEHFASLFLGM